MTVTRFCPNIFSGSLTIGHALNIFLNVLYAKQNNGRFFVVHDIIDDRPHQQPNILYGILDQSTIAGQHSAQYAIETAQVLEQLLPGVSRHTICMNGSAALIAVVMENQIESFPSQTQRSVTILAATDYLIGTTAIMRGNDYCDSSLHKNSNLTSRMMIHQMLLDRFARKEGNDCGMEYWYHPLLVDEQGLKISKSGRKQGHSLKVLFESMQILPLSIISYVFSLLEGQYVGVAEIMEYHHKFDVAKVCAVEQFVYREQDLLYADERIYRELEAELGLPPDDSNINKYYKLLAFSQSKIAAFVKNVIG